MKTLISLTHSISKIIMKKITSISILFLFLLCLADIALASEFTGSISTGLSADVGDQLTGVVLPSNPPTGGGGGGGGGSSIVGFVPVINNSSSTASSTFLEIEAKSYPYFTRTLKLGSRGEDVVWLQERLRKEGIFTFTTSTGYFGPITREALKNYQKKNKIPQTGTLYLRVRNLLNFHR